MTGAAPGGPVDDTAQVTGTDGEVFSAMGSGEGAMDTNVKSMRYLDDDIYTPPSTMPVTWTVSAS